jgi:alkylation response protein AidB-like acyl-CoA dehydrogenase
MDQPGVEVRPITQLTRTSEFNEVFFDGARTRSDHVVGEVGQGWKVALATLAFERGVGLLGHQLSFRRELDRLIDVARANGTANDPVIRQRLARSYAELEILRYNTLRSLSGYDGPVAPPEASIIKLYWATWHRQLGELALDVRGPAGLVGEGFPYELDEFQRTFLFSRSETIYGGSNEIQKNIIGERVLGLPPEPKGTTR